MTSFEQLSDQDKQTVAIEILRRMIDVDLPVLSDEELTLNAEELFLSLEQSENE
jgi:hypothetical protein